MTMNPKSGTVEDKLRSLARLFERFNFPPVDHLFCSKTDREYFKAIKGLYGLDEAQLDDLASEILEEWQLSISMGHPESRETYLDKFTTRVNATYEEIMEPLTSTQTTLIEMEEQEKFGTLSDRAMLTLA
jgi:hypothetical protein